MSEGVQLSQKETCLSLRKVFSQTRQVTVLVVTQAPKKRCAFVSSIVQSAGAPRSLENGAESCRRLQMSL